MYLTYVRHLLNASVPDMMTFINKYSDKVPVYLGVYGTLRQGARAHGFLKGMEFVEKKTMGGHFRMLSINGNFPAIIDCEQKYHPGYGRCKAPLLELYSGITEERLQRLDAYEGFPHLYNREILQVYDKQGNTSMYVCVYTWAGDAKKLKEYSMVVSGDWLKNEEETAKEENDINEEEDDMDVVENAVRNRPAPAAFNWGGEAAETLARAQERANIERARHAILERARLAGRPVREE